ncbi:MAG: DUF935 family protein [Rhodocyclaceae bacterium]|nr:MAG: DUF935 family protein [Rhodocyclaceae bacterium]
MKPFSKLREAIRLFSEPGLYVARPPANKPLETELTRPGGVADPSPFSVTEVMPNPDSVLRELGLTETAYTEILQDSQVAGAFRSRKAGVQKLRWAVDRDQTKSAEAQAIEEMFSRLDMFGIIGAIMNCLPWGFQPLEIVWRRRGSLIEPEKITAPPRKYFRFNRAGDLLLASQFNPSGGAVPPRKFLIARHEATTENPYGNAILGQCFWPVKVKKGGMRWWVNFAEKYGMPWPLIRYHEGDEERLQSFMSVFTAAVQDAVLLFPDSLSVDIAQTGSPASAEIFERLRNACREEIDTAWLSHNAGTTATPGKLGGDVSAESARGDLIGADIKLVEDVFNTLIRWIYELNWGNVSRPPQFMLYEESDVDKGLADRDKILFDIGFRPKKDYFVDVYRLKPEHFDIDPNAAGADSAPTFAEGKGREGDDAQAVIDAIAGRLTPEQLQFQAEQFLKPVVALITRSASYSEAMEGLAELYPKVNTGDLQAVLERAIFIAETVGRVSVNAESE